MVALRDTEIVKQPQAEGKTGTTEHKSRVEISQMRRQSIQTIERACELCLAEQHSKINVRHR